METKKKIENFLQQNYPQYNTLVNIYGGGSDKEYYRFSYADKTLLLTHNNNIQENNSFFKIGEKLKEILPQSFPHIEKIDSTKTIYTQTDFGDQTLLDLWENKPDNAKEIYKQVVSQLPFIQTEGDKLMDSSYFFDEKSFHKMLILRDLFYFKDYFIDLLELPYLQSALLKDFKRLVASMKGNHYTFFMYRDLQARNIMVKDGIPRYIDFQGGMTGPAAYDLVSLLWQAKAALPIELKDELYNIYIKNIRTIIPSFSEELFQKDYNTCLIIRTLQVLGAYGKLGIIQKKPYFIESLTHGVNNLVALRNDSVLDRYPSLLYIVHKIEDINWQNKLL